MSSLSDAEWDQACADYRAAKAGVTAALSRQSAAELERHRTGVDDGSVAQAAADADWCRALVVACGEIVKGATFEEVAS